jgi:hypothetical protein
LSEGSTLLNPYSSCRVFPSPVPQSEVFDVDLHEAAMNLALHRLFVPSMKQAQNSLSQDTQTDHSHSRIRKRHRVYRHTTGIPHPLAKKKKPKSPMHAIVVMPPN